MRWEEMTASEAVENADWIGARLAAPVHGL